MPTNVQRTLSSSGNQRMVKSKLTISAGVGACVLVVVLAVAWLATGGLVIEDVTRFDIDPTVSLGVSERLGVALQGRPIQYEIPYIYKSYSEEGPFELRIRFQKYEEKASVLVRVIRAEITVGDGRALILVGPENAIEKRSKGQIVYSGGEDGSVEEDSIQEVVITCGKGIEIEEGTMEIPCTIELEVIEGEEVGRVERSMSLIRRRFHWVRSRWDSIRDA